MCWKYKKVPFVGGGYPLGRFAPSDNGALRPHIPDSRKISRPAGLWPWHLWGPKLILTLPELSENCIGCCKQKQCQQTTHVKKKYSFFFFFELKKVFIDKLNRDLIGRITQIVTCTLHWKTWHKLINKTKYALIIIKNDDSWNMLQKDPTWLHELCDFFLYVCVCVCDCVKKAESQRQWTV